MTSTSKQWAIQIVAAICCLLSIWSISNRLQNSLPQSGTWDFPIFISHANQFLETGALYDKDLSKYEPGAPIYKFPPLSGAVLVTTLEAGMTPDTLKAAGTALQLTSFFGGILWLTLTLLPKRKAYACILTLCLSATLLPTLEENLLRLQLEPALLFLLICTSIFTHKNKYFYAGLAIGIATALKIYPVMAMLFFAFTRKKHVFSGFVISMTLANIFTFLSLGKDENIFFLTKILPALLKENPLLDAENISTTLLLTLLKTSIPIETLTKALRTAFLATQVGFYFMFAKHLTHIQNAEDKTMETLAFSMVIPFALASMPNAFWNYQLLLALPLTALSCTLLGNLPNPKDFNAPLFLQISLLSIILLALHITAAMTVDNRYYPNSFTVKVIALLSRIAIQILTIIVIWLTISAHIKKARTISDSGF